MEDCYGDVNCGNQSHERTIMATSMDTESHHCDMGVVFGQDGVQQTSKFTYHQKITFVSVLLATFAIRLSFSIIAVFFPSEAKAKGMSHTVTGLVFSTFSTAAVIGAPIWGKILPLVGARFVFLAGAFVTGSCDILFGLMVDMPTEATFTAFCFVIRIMEGLGSSACITASSAILAYIFPDDIGTAMSINEMMSGLSFAIGPAIGGLLFEVGGFKLPFFVLGGFTLLSVAVNYMLMPQQGTGDERSGSVVQMLSVPAVLVALFAMIVCFIGMSCLDPTLSLHLEKLHFTTLENSFVFVTLGVTYSVTSVVWGRVADKLKTTRFMTVIATFGAGVCFLLLGPSPLLKIPSSKLIPWLVTPFCASFLSLIAVSALLDMFISAEWNGIAIDLGATGVISGLWSSALSLGSMIGPLLGGFLTDLLGFAYAFTAIAGGYIVTMIAICLFGVWEYRCGKGRRKKKQRLVLETGTQDERALLMSSNQSCAWRE
ncbi:MFS-type transporter SLC18B1-like [Acanthaster planci]|uniref:MFS-type transporter SLC18B1-like n=1 Tax=Acanthaster planci TaxID=133434 RepID=A0A8B7Z706_ACAPL|nr:MFS-type transporter SLC18B1-like [Acanthaster planci]XP_022101428.1 MFS-type transporter SLC18B1-like [Acanthaster planci]